MPEMNWAHITSGATFEDLIRGLIFFDDPQAYLFGRSGRDDGQDARSGDGHIVYQMKFHQSDSASQAIRDAKAEAGKIAQYRSQQSPAQAVWQGVRQWILVSNVSFSPRDVQKWADEVQPLFKKIGLTASYWTKQEIENRLHKYPELKSSYFGGETRLFLGLTEAREQIRLQEFHHPDALSVPYQGQELELEQYRQFLNSAKRILVVHGPGGIGKTRFLLESAEREASQGWQIYWANVASMSTASSWYSRIIPEHPTLLLIDEPQDEMLLKILVEQISTGRATRWKVVIAVRSPNDPVLGFFRDPRSQPLVETLHLPPLYEQAAVEFCTQLIESGALKAQYTDWKNQAASWIGRRYEGYPIWMAMAIDLLEREGNLEEMPQASENLASKYLNEIITRQSDFQHEQLLNVLRWIALIGTLNTEDHTALEFIKTNSGLQGQTAVHRCLDVLISRRVIFARGARNRLLEIKPDVLADHILREWLTLKVQFGSDARQASSEAIELTTRLSRMLESDEYASLSKSLLRGIARFELVQQLSNDPVALLKPLVAEWRGHLSTLNTHQKLAYLGVLSDISFTCVSDVIGLLREVLSSNSDSVTLSTIFGDRIFTHDDVILALPWIVYTTARYARTDSEQVSTLLLFCELLVIENKILQQRSQKLSNDGRRAHTLLPRVIEGGPDFLGNFETIAYERAMWLLSQSSFRKITDAQKLILDTLTKPLFKVEREYTLFDGRVVKIQRVLITPEKEEWTRRNNLKLKIQELLSLRDLDISSRILLWQLLNYAHSAVNQATSQTSGESSSLNDAFRDDMLHDLHWVKNFLESHSPDIQEFAAAREIWDWHYEFNKDAEMKEAAIQCETLFRQTTLFSDYEPLLSWEDDYKVLFQRANDKVQLLVRSGNSEAIHEFVENGIKYLGGSDNISRLFLIAESLGSEASSFQSVREFIEEALKLSPADAKFKFASRICRAWIRSIRDCNTKEVVTVLENILQWVTTGEQVVHLTQVIYENTWLINPTDSELKTVLNQHNHFIEQGQNAITQFLGLLGGWFIDDPQKVAAVAKTVLDEIDEKYLPDGVAALLQSLNYARKSKTDNTSRMGATLLRDWVLEQILRLPDIDALAGSAAWHLNSLLSTVDKPGLQWLVTAIEERIQRASEPGKRSIRILPSRERLSLLIEPISLEAAEDKATRHLISKLLSLSESIPMMVYGMPRYIADIDPLGAIAADLIVDKLVDWETQQDPRKIYHWAKFAGYYPDNSSVWRRIAHEVSFLAQRFDDYHKYSILHALTNPDPKVWTAQLGEVSPSFDKEVEIAKQRLESETDAVLLPFRQWVLEQAEAELSRESERVKEEFDE